ncbi:MAG: hypothetical protein DSO07_05115 [Thermoproteota archaeon]|nr:MAG: hypothetical protein DSO07_05115 [Candidatus Korarchaeota archaeon]
MKAKFKVLEKKGSTIVVGVVLEDGRAFIVMTGEDKARDIPSFIKEHAKNLFGTEVDKVEESK